MDINKTDVVEMSFQKTCIGRVLDSRLANDHECFELELMWA